MFNLALLLMIVAGAVAVVTERLRVPYTLALVIAGLVIGNLHLVPPVRVTPELLLGLLIPALLFEGGLGLPPARLLAHGALIGLLAVPGTLAAALAIAAAAAAFGLGWHGALLLGAIASAIDPVSVLALMREAGLDRRLAAVIEGEAVFNDGVAIVLFTLVAAGVAGGLLGAAGRFVWLLGGGLLAGLVVAGVVSRAMGRTRQPMVEALGSVIAALGAFVAAGAAGASGVIAVAMAGVVFGSYGLRYLTETGRQTVRVFWGVIAFLANSVLFLIIGLEVPAALLGRHAALIGIVIAAALLVRAVTVYGCAALVDAAIRPVPMAWRHVLTWGGLRGGVAIALALDVPDVVPGREAIVAGTLGLVVFTLLGQGLTIPALIRRVRIGGEAGAWQRPASGGKKERQTPDPKEPTSGELHTRGG